MSSLALSETPATAVPPGVDLVLFNSLRELPHLNPEVEASGVLESVTSTG
jgi:hypothetical protein